MTHLEGNQTIAIDGYDFISHHRTIKYKNAAKIHGAVGMFIKREIYDMYNIFTIDKCKDSILGVQFVNKATNYTIFIFAC